MSEIENIAAFLAKNAIEGANKGYAEDAEEFAFYAAILLRENDPLPTEVRMYLAEALHKISEGVPANKALKLNGRKKQEVLEVELLMAKTIFNARKSGYKLEYLYAYFVENGFPVSKSVTLHRPLAVIKAAYNRHKKDLEAQGKETI